MPTTISVTHSTRIIRIFAKKHSRRVAWAAQGVWSNIALNIRNLGVGID